VCAAISILGYTALNSLIEVANIDTSSLRYTIIEDKGYMKVNLKENVGYTQSQCAQIIFQTLIIGLRLLNEEYKEYISIDFEEVD
jgi:Predicted ribosomal protein